MQHCTYRKLNKLHKKIDLCFFFTLNVSLLHLRLSCALMVIYYYQNHFLLFLLTVLSHLYTLIQAH